MGSVMGNHPPTDGTQARNDRSDKRIVHSDKPKGSERTFTRIDNGLLNDPDLSGLAVGIGCFLLSKPDYWKFSISSLTFRFREGREAIARAMKELEDAGYLVRRRASGGARCENYFYEIPRVRESVDGIPVAKSRAPEAVRGTAHTGTRDREAVALVTTEGVTTERVTTEEKLRNSHYSSATKEERLIPESVAADEEDFIYDDSLDQRIECLDHASDEVIDVYSHYLAVQGKPSDWKPGKDESEHILARRRDGFSVDDLRMVVTQAKVDSFWSDTTKNHGGRITGYMKSRDHVHRLLVEAKEAREKADAEAARKAAWESDRRSRPDDLIDMEALRKRLLLDLLTEESPQPVA